MFEDMQTLGQVELWSKRDSGAYEIGKVYTLPKHLDEKNARLHSVRLGVELTLQAIPLPLLEGKNAK